jgi:hypothetical protein
MEQMKPKDELGEAILELEKALKEGFPDRIKLEQIVKEIISKSASPAPCGEEFIKIIGSLQDQIIQNLIELSQIKNALSGAKGFNITIPNSAAARSLGAYALTNARLPSAQQLHGQKYCAFLDLKISNNVFTIYKNYPLRYLGRTNSLTGNIAFADFTWFDGDIAMNPVSKEHGIYVEIPKGIKTRLELASNLDLWVLVKDNDEEKIEFELFEIGNNVENITRKYFPVIK